MVYFSDDYGPDECSDMILGYWKPHGEFCDKRKVKIRSAMDRCGITAYGVAFLCAAKSLGPERRKLLINLLA